MPIHKKHKSHSVKVEDVMSSPAVVASTETSLSDAVKLM